MQTGTFVIDTVEWLNRRVAPEGVTIDADTRLFERGIVDSLGILRLIAWTERAIGRRIQDREIRMDRFGSVREIAENFVRDFVAERLAAERGAAAERSCAAERASGAELRPACAACGRCSRRAA